MRNLEVGDKTNGIVDICSRFVLSKKVLQV